MHLFPELIPKKDKFQFVKRISLKGYVPPYLNTDGYQSGQDVLVF